jgi:hypothetical protein
VVDLGYYHDVHYALPMSGWVRMGGLGTFAPTGRSYSMAKIKTVKSSKVISENWNLHPRCKLVRSFQNMDIGLECSYLVMDMFLEISNHIQEGSTWKAFTQSCRSLYKLNTREKIDRYSNHLLTLLTKHPPGEENGWKWSMKELSQNPALPWSLVEAHPPGEEYGWKWNMAELSCHPSLPWSMVEAHPEWKWDINKLSINEFNKYKISS